MGRVDGSKLSSEHRDFRNLSKRHRQIPARQLRNVEAPYNFLSSADERPTKIRISRWSAVGRLFEALMLHNTLVTGPLC